jgi:hypothetical protein
MEHKQIEQAANEANTFLMASPWHCYIAGATMVNELQPYTAEDMKKFAEDCNKRGCFYSHNDKLWWYRYSDDKQTSDELLKLWEEQRNEQGIR